MVLYDISTHVYNLFTSYSPSMTLSCPLSTPAHFLLANQLPFYFEREEANQFSQNCSQDLMGRVVCRSTNNLPVSEENIFPSTALINCPEILKCGGGVQLHSPFPTLYFFPSNRVSYLISYCYFIHYFIVFLIKNKLFQEADSILNAY